jgi:hypothetical protein
MPELLQKLRLFKLTRNRSNFTNAIFDTVDASNVDLTDAILHQLRTVNSDFTNAILRRANATEAVFDKTKFCNVDARATNFKNADFRGVDASNTDFTDAILKGTLFDEVKAKNTKFVNVEFEDVDARATNFENADFRCATVYQTDFTDARFMGAQNVAPYFLHPLGLNANIYDECSALEVLMDLRCQGLHVIHSSEISQVHREQLMDKGYLREAVAEWYYITSPMANSDDRTSWYSSAWEFLARYANHFFDQNWHLSPELSLVLEVQKHALPSEIIISSPQGSNNYLRHPSGVFLDLKVKEMPPSADVTTRDGLRCFTKDAALIAVSEDFYKKETYVAQSILISYSDVTSLVTRLLDGDHAVAAGRIAGAFRHMAKPQLADQIMTAMRSAGHDLVEQNPFTLKTAADFALALGPSFLVSVAGVGPTPTIFPRQVPDANQANVPTANITSGYTPGF